MLYQQFENTYNLNSHCFLFLFACFLEGLKWETVFTRNCKNMCNKNMVLLTLQLTPKNLFNECAAGLNFLFALLAMIYISDMEKN